MSPLLSATVIPLPVEDGVADRPADRLADDPERDSRQRAGDRLGAEDA